MNDSVQLCLVLHNHQPIGNFDGVIEQAYRDSYLPFLEVFENYADLRISLHTSGPLMRWLIERHPDYVARVRSLVAAERIEIIGGPFYEPILPMLPSRDRIGQIRTYTEFLNRTFDTSVNGMWMPERVWETSLTSDIARAGIAYTVLDDYHFKAAGWSEESLRGYHITEDNGQVLRIFPGSEKLHIWYRLFRLTKPLNTQLKSLAKHRVPSWSSVMTARNLELGQTLMNTSILAVGCASSSTR